MAKRPRVQGICIQPGCTNKQRSREGGKVFDLMCDRHVRLRQGLPPSKIPRFYEYRKHKKSYCEQCGPGVKYHRCQLDVDHIDGNKLNDDPSNFQTLCANCHRLKTFHEKLGCNDAEKYPVPMPHPRSRKMK